MKASPETLLPQADGASLGQSQCCAMVRGEGQWGGFHKHQCKKKPSIERDGKAYCKVHDPVARAEREAVSIEKYHAKQKAERPKWYAQALLELLIESQTSIGGDWRQRRDALIKKITE